MARDQRERGDGRSTMDYYEYKRMRELRRMQSATNVENPTVRQNINRISEDEEKEQQPPQKKPVDKLLGGIKGVISGASQRASEEKYEEEPFTMDETISSDAQQPPQEEMESGAEEWEEEDGGQSAAPFASAMNMARKLGGGIKNLAGKARAMRQKPDDQEDLAFLEEIDTPEEAAQPNSEILDDDFGEAVDFAQPVHEPYGASDQPEQPFEEEAVDIMSAQPGRPAAASDAETQEPEGVFSLEDEETEGRMDGLKQNPIFKKIGGFFKFLAKGELEDDEAEDDEEYDEDSEDEEEEESSERVRFAERRKERGVRRRNAPNDEEEEDWLDEQPSDQQDEFEELDMDAEPLTPSVRPNELEAETMEAEVPPQDAPGASEQAQEADDMTEEAPAEVPADVLQTPDWKDEANQPVPETQQDQPEGEATAEPEKSEPLPTDSMEEEAAFGEDFEDAEDSEDDEDFEDDEDDEEGEPFNPFGWIKEKLNAGKKARPTKDSVLQDEEQDDEDFEDDIDFEESAFVQPAVKQQAERGSRFVAEDGSVRGMDVPEQNERAPEARQDKGGSQMEDKNRKPSMTELLAAELDDQPDMSRRARRQRAEAQEAAQNDVAQPTEENEFPVDEPTVEFKPIRSRTVEPVSEKPAPRKKRPVRTVELPQEDEDEDEDEEELEERRPVRRPAQPKRAPKPQGKKRRVYSDEDYDDEYDDDDYDDDYDDEHVGFGKRFLGFLKVLVIIVLILALSVLALQQLEANGRVNLDWLRNTVGAVLPVEKVFPDPDQSLTVGPEAGEPNPAITLQPVDQKPADQQPADQQQSADQTGDAAPNGQAE